MLNQALLALMLAVVLRPATALATSPTKKQKCEAAVEAASGKFAQCKLGAESAFAKSGKSGKLSGALAKCTSKLDAAFSKAATKYGGACPMTEPVGAFDTYLTKCSDDTSAAAGGAPFPDCPGQLASCNADLATAQGDLATCQAALATCQTASSSAQLLKTGRIGVGTLPAGDGGWTS